MKIKLFFAALAAVAFLAASCSEEEIGSNGTDVNGLIKGKTVATFTLNLSNPTTKALYSFDPDGKQSDANQERKINPADVRLLIFDLGSGILDVNQKFDVTPVGGIPYSTDVTGYKLTKTVQLMAGDKKIYVIANAGSITTAIAALTEDVSTLAAFNAIVFNAGTPQFPWTAKTPSERSFHIDGLYAFSGTTYGLPASNTDQYTYQLKAGIPAEESNTNSSGTGGSATVTGSTVRQDYNYFEIDLIYMLAKGRLGYTEAALSSTTPSASISDIKYSIHNLARYTNFIQHVVGGLPLSYYDGMDFTTPFFTSVAHTANDDYGTHFDAGVTVKQAGTKVTGSPSGYVFDIDPDPYPPFLYVPENNNRNAILTWGQASHFAVNAHYKPNNIITAVSYQPTSVPPLQLSQTSTHPSPAVAYFYLLKDVGSIKTGTCFLTYALMQQACWLALNATNIPGGGWDPGTHSTVADGIIGSAPSATVPSELPDPALSIAPYGYYHFQLPNTTTNTGGNWYRVAIGDPNNEGSNPAHYKFGVYRGKSYEVILTSFGGPGVPYEWMLISDPGEPVDAVTNVTVIVQIKDWDNVQWEHEIP